ncbi:MAG: DUF2156 domain-containing protein, partial [Nitrospira sp.]|nr:DUF2156 domain-containing protein [Nitrospira sp.]
MTGAERQPAQLPPAPLRIVSLNQFVPSRVCLTCDVCCRFPEEDSFLRPYFTAEEIGRAMAAGLDPSQFPDHSGCQVRVVPNPAGEGYLCPAFDPATAHCRIYEGRPLDCQIYPLALMWSDDRREVLLGWDSKCPFLRGEGPVSREPLEGGPEARESGDIRVYAEQVAHRLESEEMLALLAAHSRFIGPFQEDVVVLRALPRLTAKLRASQPLALQPLTNQDRPLIERALASTREVCRTPLAVYAFAPHAIWRNLFTYWRAEIDGHLCLFAEYEDGLFLALPPLGPGPIAGALARACALMRERNRGSAVTRVENVPEELKPQFEAQGYRLAPKGVEYLYRAADLANLVGDRYKSPRAACNRFARDHQYRYGPYRPTDREACLALYRLWAAQQEARDLSAVDAVARHMLADSASAHREALTQAEALGLTGRVVRIDGEVRAYTFG